MKIDSIGMISTGGYGFGKGNQVKKQMFPD
jgi:hypothetical protein